MAAEDLQQQLKFIRAQAVRDLEQTKTMTADGHFYPAGPHQFGSFWVRDFALSVPGLLQIGDDSTVERQLRKILSMQGTDGFLPRGFDTLNPKMRVLRHTVLRFLPGDWPGHHGALRAEYLGEHKTPAFDSNALVLIAILEWALKSPERFEQLRKDFVLSSLLKSYVPHLQDGLVVQAPFSDWQDSANRQGKGLFVNLVVLKAVLLSQKFGIEVPKVFLGLAERIHSAFYSDGQGLYAQTPEKKQFPLEANLWIATENLLGDLASSNLSQKIQQHPFWKTPGLPVFPLSLSQDIAWTTKVVGLRHYHDGLSWGWLLADQAFAASLWDEALLRKIVHAQSEAIKRFGTIHEVYNWDNGALRPFSSVLYRAEGPFTWAAARWIAAIDKILSR